MKVWIQYQYVLVGFFFVIRVSFVFIFGIGGKIVDVEKLWNNLLDQVNNNKYSVLIESTTTTTINLLVVIFFIVFKKNPAVLNTFLNF